MRHAAYGGGSFFSGLTGGNVVVGLLVGGEGGRLPLKGGRVGTGPGVGIAVGGRPPLMGTRDGDGDCAVAKTTTAASSRSTLDSILRTVACSKTALELLWSTLPYLYGTMC